MEAATVSGSAPRGPVTVFLNRDGTVQAVYSGFSGPATGVAHSQARAEFQRLATEILQSE